MNEKLTEVVFILDRSGSMSGMESDTIGGFNSMLEKQQAVEGEVVVSTILFDDKVETLHDRMALKDVKPMTRDEYYVRGCTALLDAVGRTLKHIGKIHKAMPEAERPQKTLCVIITDGYENASREYSYEKVKEMITKRQEKRGWEFIFLGANIDAVAEAGRFGIKADRAARYENDSEGVEANFGAVSACMHSARMCCSFNDHWADEIKENYERKNKK